MFIVHDVDQIFYYHCFLVPRAFSLNNQTFPIETLTGGNYKRWKEDVELALIMMDVDMAIKFEKPTDLTIESTIE